MLSCWKMGICLNPDFLQENINFHIIFGQENLNKMFHFISTNQNKMFQFKNFETFCTDQKFKTKLLTFLN